MNLKNHTCSTLKIAAVMMCLVMLGCSDDGAVRMAVLEKIQACYSDFDAIDALEPGTAEQVTVARHHIAELRKFADALPRSDVRREYLSWAGYWEHQVDQAAQEQTTHAMAQELVQYEKEADTRETAAIAAVDAVSVRIPSCCDR